MLTQRFEKKYFVIYDINDNILLYIDNLDELSNKINMQKKEISRKFKKNNIFIKAYFLKKEVNIYQFCD